MKKNRLIVGGIIVLIFLMGSILVWHFGIFESKEQIVVGEKDPAIEKPIEEPIVEEFMVPNIILTGNFLILHPLLEIRQRYQGHIVTFDVYRKNELEGTITIAGEIRENKIQQKYFFEIIDKPMSHRKIFTIIDNLDLKIQQVDFFEDIIEYQMPFKSFIFDYEKNKTMIEFWGIEHFRFRQEADAFERINPQLLEVGWKRKFPITMLKPGTDLEREETEKKEDSAILIEIVGKETITVPAGTFDVLKLRVNLRLRAVDHYFDYYITREGGLIKYVHPRQDRIYKLRDYSPIEVK